MREVETDNPVIWPSWCYNTGENRIETEPLKGTTIKSPIAKSKKKRRPISSPTALTNKRGNGLSAIENRCPTPSTFTNATSSSTSNATAAIKMEVKTERLSPASGITDNNSSGSGSNTPSSSYPETPPGASQSNDRIPSPSLSPAAQLSHAKMPEPPRNYSDIIRSLAAKYNNTNPNDYFNSSKNGLSFGDPRFTSFKTSAVSPFTGLINPLSSGSSSPPSALNSSCHIPGGSTNTKDSNETDLKHMLGVNEAQNSIFSTFGLNSFNASAVGGVGLPLFSPLMEMGPTQALLNMVRSASSSSNTTSQVESYMKSTSVKRSGELTNNPLDLSSNAPPAKKVRRPLGSNESFSAESISRSKDRSSSGSKRTGSVSPKPRPKSTQSNSSVSPADQRASNCLSICTSLLDRSCPSRESVESVSNWSIDDVHNFVSSIDICAEYADNFREQSIDGISLPLLTEEHLRTTMNMKLGPTLKFRAILAQKIGHCNVCMHCLHCHGNSSSAGTNGHNLTPFPSSSPPLNISSVRPNSVGN